MVEIRYTHVHVPRTVQIQGLAGRRIDSLTGLRGFAVLIVFVSHCANRSWLPDALGSGTGQLGVMLFFVLSGFLMTALYLPTAPARPQMGSYLRARLGRVAPLFVAVVVGSWVLGPHVAGWPYHITDVGLLAENLLFIRGAQELWAVPVEVQFYAVFLMIWGASYVANRFVAARYVALVVAVSFVGAGYSLARIVGDLPANGLYLYVQYFLIGMAIPLLTPYLDRLRLARGRFPTAWIASGAVLVFFASSLPAFRRAIDLTLPQWLDPAIALSVLLMFLMTLYRVGIFRIMESRILVFFGTISYGMYLLHPIVLGIAETMLPAGLNLPAVAVLLAISTGLASMSYWLFELPTLGWCKRARSA